MFRGARNVRFLMGDVARIDFEAKVVHLADGAALPYDYVVLAAGSRTNFFGNDDLARHALGLKDLGEALQLRNHVLDCLERAAATDDADERRRLLTFCIVGGGPTGVEYAGALGELVRLVLPQEYPELARDSVRIVVLEGADRLLTMFKPRLSGYAREGVGATRRRRPVQRARLRCDRQAGTDAGRPGDRDRLDDLDRRRQAGGARR